MYTKPARKLNQSTKGTVLPKSARVSKLPNNARLPVKTVTPPNTIAATAIQFTIQFAFIAMPYSPKISFTFASKASSDSCFAIGTNVSASTPTGVRMGDPASSITRRTASATGTGSGPSLIFFATTGISFAASARYGDAGETVAGFATNPFETKRVPKRPGITEWTRIPKGPASYRRESVIASTAYLLAL